MVNFWEQVEFGQLGIISRGLTYRPNDVTDKDGVRVLRSSNIYEDSFVLNDNDVFINSSVVNVPNLKNGDILVTSANGSSRLVGKHAIIKGLSNKTVHGGFMLAIRPATNSYFLNSLMSTSWYDNFISTFVSGGNGSIGNLKKSDLERQSIFIPLNKEQNKIGQLFQSLDKTITLHEEKQRQLERLNKALLQKMFADKTGYPALRFKGFTEKWEQVEFGQLGIISRGLTYRPNDVTDKDGVRVLRSSNIYEDSFVLNDNDVFINSSVVNVPNLKNGDILVTSANGSSRLVGKHAIIKGLSNKTVHGGFMLAIRPATNSYFLNSLMSTSWYDNFISTFVSGGNGSIGNLKKSDLERQSIFIPLNKEQNKIGQLFQSLDKTITLHDKKIQYLKQLKRGLLQKMFV